MLPKGGKRRISLVRTELDAADSAVVAGEIARLIGLLDDDSTEIAEGAKAKLMSMGELVTGSPHRDRRASHSGNGYEAIADAIECA